MSQRFGRYRVVSELGPSGLADVHLGVAPGPLQGLVRIHRLRAGASATPTQLAHFDEAALKRVTAPISLPFKDAWLGW